MHDIVTIPLPRDIGFTQLPDTSGAQIHEVTPSTTMTVTVPKGATAIEVPLEGVATQADTAYQVYVTPSFNAGGHWVTGKNRQGFALHVAKAPEQDATVDVLVQRTPYRKQYSRESQFED